MSVSSQTVSLSDLIQERQWLEAYKRILFNIIYFGLLIFIGGIYIFPNDSGTQQVFYLFVTIPFIFILPIVLKELPWSNLYFILYMLFPLYMFASHSWAPDENIQRGWFFFFRQLVCFYIFFCSAWLIICYKDNFLNHVVIFVFSAGFLSSILSILQHVLVYGSEFRNIPISGYSIVDIDKVGAIHVINVYVALFFLFKYIRNKHWAKLSAVAVAIFTQLYLIYLTKTLGNILVVALAPLVVAIIALNDFYKKLFICLIYFTAFAVIQFKFDLVSIFLQDYNVLLRADAILNSYLETKNNLYFGEGLTYKLDLILNHIPLSKIQHHEKLIHSHNIFADTFRFGGAVGVMILFLHFGIPTFTMLFLCGKGAQNLNFYLGWCVSGIMLSCLYAQQPYVRPGSFIWFFYWIPVTMLYQQVILRQGNGNRI